MSSDGCNCMKPRFSQRCDPAPHEADCFHRQQHEQDNDIDGQGHELDEIAWEKAQHECHDKEDAEAQQVRRGVGIPAARGCEKSTSAPKPISVNSGNSICHGCRAIGAGTMPLIPAGSQWNWTWV